MLGAGITDLTRPVRLRDRTEHATRQVAVSELTANQHAKVVTGRKGLVHLASSARRPREARACGSEARTHTQNPGSHLNALQRSSRAGIGLWPNPVNRPTGRGHRDGWNVETLRLRHGQNFANQLDPVVWHGDVADQHVRPDILPDCLASSAESAVVTSAPQSSEATRSISRESSVSSATRT